MNPVELDPGDYSGTYKLVGGEMSLDFVNTISWPGTSREHDWLDRPGNLIAWSNAVGILSRSSRARLEAKPSTTSWSALRTALEIRAQIRSVVWPLANGARPSREAVKALNALLQKSLSHYHIDPSTCLWKWDDPASMIGVLYPVIWNAAHVLTDRDRTRIRSCPSCDWIFYDSTRNRSRRWCDMKDCGSRDKALRYYHRTKSSGSP